ncbi:DUF6427 family protein [Flavobacterium sp. HXWNR69]|uniref:DUF6427 family protein n=1 Tax=Flavobacterium fragile TaxID=2949085 RepID=A0ABT0TEU5_9FLAO|nr:DUF6427 family protein [Flavobacterium sp. HXWNR69]MCL9769489.1 DUF6427 family protein [Flavobacterium sp. HXWNR69]
MLASIFSKTRPFNYLVVGVLSLIFFSVKIIALSQPNANWIYYAEEFGLYLLIFASLFLVNFISLKNGLTKGNNYALFLFFIFLLFFSTIFQNKNIIISNFLLLLALRRLISLKSLLQTKEKIFDASFWIFLSALFHFWSIFYIVLVFVAVILHVSKDYRNWIIPFIALFAVTVLFFLANSISDNNLMATLLSKTYISLDFYYFENIYQRIALAAFSSISLFLFATHLFDIPNKALNMQSSHKTILFSFILGVGIYILSTNKNNGCLAFCFGPLAIIGANFIEKIENNWVREGVVYALLGLGIFFFVMEL